MNLGRLTVFGRGLFFGLIAFGVVSLPIAHGKAQAWEFALFWMIVLTGVGAFVAAFTFHIDVIGVNAVVPWLWRDTWNMEPGERQLLSSPGISVTFDGNWAGISGFGWLILTNRRIVVKHLMSFPGLCACNLLLDQIESVRFMPRTSFLGSDAMRIELKSGAPLREITIHTTAANKLYRHVLQATEKCAVANGVSSS